jgi:hypothetical protein
MAARCTQIPAADPKTAGVMRHCRLLPILETSRQQACHPARPCFLPLSMILHQIRFCTPVEGHGRRGTQHCCPGRPTRQICRRRLIQCVTEAVALLCSRAFLRWHTSVQGLVQFSEDGHIGKMWGKPHSIHSAVMGSLYKSDKRFFSKKNLQYAFLFNLLHQTVKIYLGSQPGAQVGLGHQS